MENCVEKIYCCDRGDNDNALAAAILANNRRDDWGPMAAMMGGGMNNWMNNPFAYLMFMATFQEQTGLPTNVVLSAEGQTQRLANVSCGSSNCLAIYSSLTVTITPAAAPAA